jgi:serine/threonine protein kinase, bacterial
VLLVDEPPLGGTTAEWPTPSQFGPYRLNRLLGRGGFGEVYEAFDTNKNRTVALKLLPSSYSANPHFRRRLFREASTAGRLNEPHVVPIHDYGEIDGQLFIDMRLIPGTDLRAVLDESGPLDPSRAVGIIGQIASALDAAHAEQIVHRDVKPANILLTPEDFACLVDFGLANAATDAKLTSAGTTIGTFAYMAPERFSEEEIDHRADIYALACVLHECLTGASPYQATDRAALMAAHLTTPIPRPSQHPGVAAGFDQVIARGMAKDRDERYPTAGELAAAARRELAGVPRHDRAASEPIDVPVTAAPASVPRLFTGRRRIALLAAAVVVVLGAAFAAVGWLNDRHTNPPAALPKPGAASIARIAATIPVGKRPEAVAVDPQSHTAYTANYGDGTISVIDTGSRAVTATIRVGNGPVSVAVDPASHTAYTANSSDGTLSAIDTKTLTVTATIPVGNDPRGVAVDPTSHTAYVTNESEGTVSVINLESQRVVGTIHIGNSPYGVAVEPAKHRVYTANHDTAVSVIDTKTVAVSGEIRIGKETFALDIDPTTHTVYTANQDNTVSVIEPGLS